MSDKEKFNDDEEYHFVDDPDLDVVDEINTTPPTDLEPPKESKNILDSVKPMLEILKQNFMLRMGVIVVVILVMSMIIYRCTSNPLVPKISEKMSQKTAVTQMKTITTPVTATKTVRQPVVVSNARPNQVLGHEQLAALGQAQADLQTKVTVLESQLTGMNANLSTMMDHLKQLNEQFAQLTLTVQNQSKVAFSMNERMKQQTQKKNRVMLRPTVHHPAVHYVLQAVIPGRAWLVSTEGNILTVREGTKIASYGVVRYIDAKRGRVLTSSGQVIGFGQDDS